MLSESIKPSFSTRTACPYTKYRGTRQIIRPPMHYGYLPVALLSRWGLSYTVIATAAVRFWPLTSSQINSQCHTTYHQHATEVQKEALSPGEANQLANIDLCVAYAISPSSLTTLLLNGRPVELSPGHDFSKDLNGGRILFHCISR